MKPDRLHRWIWALIYGGLLTMGLGWSVQRGNVGLGWMMLVAGAMAAVLGFALIAVRARMKDES